MMRFLQVFANQKVAGVVSDQQGDWAFEYTNEWLQDAEAYPLSPALPLRLELFQDTPFHRPVQSFFENLLPVEHVRTALARFVRLPVSDTFGVLTLYGQECLGSIQLLPPTEKYTDTISVTEIPASAIQHWVQQLPHRPFASQLDKKMLLPAAFPVLATIYFEQRFFQPVGAMVSTHIAYFNQLPKPFASPPSFAVNIWFCTRLARMLELSVAEVQFHFSDVWMVVVTRTDRTLQEDVWLREPIINGAQLLDLPTDTLFQPVSQEQLLQIIALCADAEQARRQIFAWTFYRLLIGAPPLVLADIHGQLSSEGVILAPLSQMRSQSCYDTLVYSGQNWPGQHLLPLSIGQSTAWQNLTLKDCHDFAESLGLDRAEAKMIAFHIMKKVMSCAQQLIAEFEQMFHAAESERELFTNTVQFATESLGDAQQCMRSIQYGVLQTLIHQVVEDIS